MRLLLTLRARAILVDCTLKYSDPWLGINDSDPENIELIDPLSGQELCWSLSKDEFQLVKEAALEHEMDRRHP